MGTGLQRVVIGDDLDKIFGLCLPRPTEAGRTVNGNGTGRCEDECSRADSVSCIDDVLRPVDVHPSRMRYQSRVALVEADVRCRMEDRNGGVSLSRPGSTKSSANSFSIRNVYLEERNLISRRFKQVEASGWSDIENAYVAGVFPTSEQLDNNPSTKKTCLLPLVRSRKKKKNQHTPPTTMYRLPVFGGT